jgi:hypothetical protein
MSGRTVRLVLRVRRFRCQNSACQQQTFAERCPEVVALHAQRTKRLTASITHFGGEVTSRARNASVGPSRHYSQPRYPLATDQEDDPRADLGP